MKYRPEIDGLRAIAVLPVLFFHAGIQLFAGGYVGVDVFFVISGYLITSLLLKDIEAEKFSLADFYERRARRILPALLTVSAVTTILVLFWQQPSQIQSFAESLVATGLFLSNVFFWRESGYFAGAAEYMPLLHTWSLAVEEQFYLFFPLVLMAAWRFFHKHLLAVILFLTLASLVLSTWATEHEPFANFFLTPTRVWELMAGAIAAWYLRSRALKGNDGLALSGIGMILAAVFVYDARTPFPGLTALLPVLGTTLVILFAAEGTWAARLLRMRFMVAIGLISYSAYLWHQPLLVIARHEFGMVLPAAVILAVMVLTLGLSGLTWYFVEQPARRRGKRSRKAVLQLAVLGCLGMVLVGLLISALQDPIRNHWLAKQTPAQRAIYLALENEHDDRSDYFRSEEGAQRLGECRFMQAQLDQEMATQLQKCAELHGPGAMVVGDSHGIDLFGMVIARYDAPFLVGVAQVQCRPHDRAAACHYDEVLNFVKNQPDVIGRVIYEQAGFYLLLDEDGRKGHRKMFRDKPLHVALPDYQPDMEHFAATFDYLQRLSEYTNVTWLGPRIEPHWPLEMLVERGCDAEFFLRPNQQAIFDNLDDYIANKVSGLAKPSLNYRSQLDILDFQPERDLLNCDNVYWSDGDHLSSAGELYFSRRLPADLLN